MRASPEHMFLFDCHFLDAAYVHTRRSPESHAEVVREHPCRASTANKPQQQQRDIPGDTAAPKVTRRSTMDQHAAHNEFTSTPRATHILAQFCCSSSVTAESRHLSSRLPGHAPKQHMRGRRHRPPCDSLHSHKGHHARPLHASYNHAGHNMISASAIRTSGFAL